MKKYMPYIISATMLIAGFLLMTKCESPQEPIDNTILISKLTNEIELLKSSISHAKIDTLVKIKKVYKTKYDTTFVEAIKDAPDTCTFYLTKLNNECIKLDSANNAIITEQETQMIKYSEVVGLMQDRNLEQQKRHVTDSTTIQSLDKKLKRTRKLAVIGIGAAFIGGLIIK